MAGAGRSGTERTMAEQNGVLTKEFWENKRAEWARSDAARDAGLTTPAGIERFDDLAYGPHDRWNMLDIYRPKNPAGRLPVNKLPVIVSIHGGGWFYGTKEVYQYYLMDLAGRGFAVVNFNYRLAPEHPFPSQLEDIAGAMRFVRDHEQEYGLDLANLFLIGDSAGGQLCGMYANLCTNPAYREEMRAQFPHWFRSEEDIVPAGISLRAVGLHCGSYDILGRAADGDRVFLDALLAPATREKMALIDVLRHMTPAFPPAYALTSEHDFLCGQLPLLEKRLTELGVPHRAKLYGKGDPQVGHVFMCNLRLAEGKLANDEECAFFREIMEHEAVRN